jgi:hypothetical protein
LTKKFRVTEKFLRRQEMRFTTSSKLFALLVTMALLLSGMFLFAQETTGGLQGTVKDASGAVVSGAHVEVTGSSLVGAKAQNTDSSGYYRFANLPPGSYTIAATAKGFKTVRREGLALEVGHLPTVDIMLEVGAAAEVVEVSGQAPVVDVTTNTNQTNISHADIANEPHGYSFQSVIQFAPMARNEPLAGGTGGTGGAPPGSTSSGAANGYMIGGASDSESSYLVEGQDTENISMGYSNANVPFEFIQEVQVKTSGIEAEHGGALGGVVNVIMKKGGNSFHGSIFGSYEGSAMNGGPTPTIRYDPFALSNSGLDNNTQTYQPKQDHFRYVQPGFNVGGPIVKDRLWFFAGFAPFFQSTSRYVNYNAAPCSTFAAGACSNAAVGNEFFNQDLEQYFGTARLDATLTQRIRVFASWLTQGQRSTGPLPYGFGLANVPIAQGGDPIASQQSSVINTAILAPPPIHGIGYVAPNSTYNFGGDITITPKIVSTTRFGYYFNNYHDFGYPTSGVDVIWGGNGTGQLGNNGQPLPLGLQQGAGTATISSYNPYFTLFNASKHDQFDEDVAFFKSGWWGTHNFKLGYQYNRLSNLISQNGNVPNTNLYFNTGGKFGAAGNGYTPFTSTGNTVCQALISAWGNCAGQYGYATIVDFATVLTKPAIDNNHAFFAQDAWTIGHGLTLNLGIRVEKESLPVPPGVIPAGLKAPTAINFSWSDKIEPRLGAAWGSANGKMKIFGSYGVVNDVMKLLLAQSSFGAQAYETCVYPLGPNSGGGFSVADITTTFVNDRACPNGTTTQGANFAGGTIPPSFTDSKTGTQLIENYNLRPWEPVAPGVKPYRQHEFVVGVDYQLAHNMAFEARYDRKRLDHIIEDSSLWDPTWGEMYTIVNPGEGVNKTLNGYASFLNSVGPAFGNPTQIFNQNGAFGTCTGCPNNPTAIRNYDGMELRLTKTTSHGWAGMFSYTWSRLWGNYTGLTTTDQIDGGVTGRASPNTTRAFDEPFYYFTYQGKSNAGPLPTDRPNAFKGNVYYTLPWKGMNTTFGLFQVAYQGSPISTATEVGGPYSGYTSPFEDTYIFGHGQWANISQDPTTGAVNIGNPYTRRTPWFTQSDVNFVHSFKVNKNNERQVFDFQATIINVLNQRSVVSYWESANSYWNGNYSAVVPNGVTLRGPGAPFYQAAENGYNIQSGLAGVNSGQFILGSNYGTPNLWQQSRKIRLGVRFTF